MPNHPMALTERFDAELERLLSGGPDTLLKMGGESDPVADFARSVAAGLGALPRRLECRFLYDAAGSALYERICEQPEYYLTRTEAGILARFASRIRRITGPVTLMELGSGSSVKTDHLLSAFLEEDPHVRYLPVDVSDSALRQATRTIRRRHGGALVAGLHGTYEEAFPLMGYFSPLMVLFLGSTVGNLDEEESAAFFSRLCGHMKQGDFLLLGIDLVKDPAVLEAAYNDAAGVTAAFTRNLFARMNRELSAGIDLSAVEHAARYNEKKRRIEIDALFTREQTIRLPLLGREFSIAAREQVRTEISRKFVLEEMIAYLCDFGLEPRGIFTDEAQWFGLLLLQKSSPETRKNTC